VTLQAELSHATMDSEENACASETARGLQNEAMIMPSCTFVISWQSVIAMAPGARRAAPLPPRSGLVVLVIVLAGRLPDVASGGAGCDLFQGRWVADESYPLYNASACPFVPDVFDCRRNGRPDDAYLKLRWSPSGGCSRLPRFDAQSSSGGGAGRRSCSWATR
jgi:hypothetical protein